MATDVLRPPSLDSELTCVLAAYRAAQLVVGTAVADDEAVGWIPRLAMVEQVSPERLPPVHGKLIALGLLRFQLLDRSGGMVYRLSPEGRCALAAATGQDVAPLTKSADEPEDFASPDDAPQPSVDSDVEVAA